MKLRNEWLEKGEEHFQKGELKEAVECWKKSAEEGSYLAMYNLGCAYYVGDGVEQSYEESIRWFEEAVEHGDMEAANRLGAFYVEGEAVPADDQLAMHYFKIAAEGGSLGGMANYGFALMIQGKKEEGLEWIEKAASKGNGAASDLLGTWALEGKNMEKDEEKAFHYFEASAKTKYQPGLEHLSVCY